VVNFPAKGGEVLRFFPPTVGRGYGNFPQKVGNRLEKPATLPAKGGEKVGKTRNLPAKDGGERWKIWQSSPQKVGKKVGKSRNLPAKVGGEG
jgi:hypothetical protein